MICEQLDDRLEAFADGSLTPTPEDQAHLAGCPACAAALERARAIESWLVTRDVPVPPAAFTATVMARIGEETWRVERVVDLGFNLFVAAGLAVIAMGAAGAAWALGIFTISIDLSSLLNAAGTQVDGRVFSQVQTMVLAAAMLTSALGLWWWAERAAD